MTRDASTLLENFVAEMDRLVVGLTLGALLLFVLLRFSFPDLMAQQIIPDVMSGLLDLFGPVFLVLMVLFVLFAVLIVVSPWGSIRLGGEDATPSFSFPAYFAMFFSAGIAAGIVFWAPAEALFHFGSPPPFVGAGAETSAAATGALETVFFHWGISAWSSYVAIGLPIAYYAYNKGAPLRVSSLLTPFLGRDGLDNPVAKLVDVLAIFATIGGVGTSIGFVGNQFLTGIEYQWGATTTNLDTLIVVGGVTVIFTVSVVTGVRRGIRRIAGVNVSLFALAALVTVVVGPTLFILSEGTAAIGNYVVGFFSMSLAPLLGAGGESWFDAWTLFYWVWWFSWAPFAGLFLASISRGRTLRSVVLTGVFASAAATLAWFAIISGTSLHLQSTGAVDILGVISQAGYEAAGFPLFNALPLGEFLVILFLTLIITWIVTSADTATLTVSILATETGVAPGTATRVFWGGLLGAFGFGLIVVGSGNALQSAAVITGGPFGIIALVGILGLLADFLRSEREPESASAGVPGGGGD